MEGRYTSCSQQVRASDLPFFSAFLFFLSLSWLLLNIRWTGDLLYSEEYKANKDSEQEKHGDEVPMCKSPLLSVCFWSHPMVEITYSCHLVFSFEKWASFPSLSYLWPIFIYLFFTTEWWLQKCPHAECFFGLSVAGRPTHHGHDLRAHCPEVIFAHGLWILLRCLEMQSQEEEKYRASEGKVVAAKSLGGMFQDQWDSGKSTWKAALERLTPSRVRLRGLQITEWHVKAGAQRLQPQTL